MWKVKYLNIASVQQSFRKSLPLLLERQELPLAICSCSDNIASWTFKPKLCFHGILVQGSLRECESIKFEVHGKFQNGFVQMKSCTMDCPGIWSSWRKTIQRMLGKEVRLLLFTWTRNEETFDLRLTAKTPNKVEKLRAQILTLHLDIFRTRIEIFPCSVQDLYCICCINNESNSRVTSSMTSFAIEGSGEQLQI